MAAHGVRTLVFSSSATVLWRAARGADPRGFPAAAANPYGRTKLMVELVLRDLAASQTGWRIALLRYFNPVGRMKAASSARIRAAFRTICCLM